jgi:putative membrane protein
LALMAAGVAVVQFVPGLSVIRHLLGFVLVGLGGVVATVAYTHWERNERAMRLGERLPHSPVPRLVAFALALIAFAALGLVAYDMVEG